MIPDYIFFMKVDDYMEGWKQSSCSFCISHQLFVSSVECVRGVNIDQVNIFFILAQIKHNLIQGRNIINYTSAVIWWLCLKGILKQITVIMLLKLVMNQIRNVGCWRFISPRREAVWGADVGKYSSTDVELDSAVMLINVFTQPSAISVRASYSHKSGQTGNRERVRVNNWSSWPCAIHILRQRIKERASEFDIEPERRRRNLPRQRCCSCSD